jgi:hypothetical protein
MSACAPLARAEAFLAGGKHPHSSPPTPRGRPPPRHYGMGTTSQFANKCCACDNLDHRCSHCTTIDTHIVTWQRRKSAIVAACFNRPQPHTSHNSEVSHLPVSPAPIDDVHNSDYEVTSPPYPVALLSIHPPLLLSDCCVVDSACFIYLSAHCDAFLSFTSSKDNSVDWVVRITIHGISFIRIRILLQLGTIVTSNVFTLFTIGLASRSSQGVSRLLSVSWL